METFYFVLYRHISSLLCGIQIVSNWNIIETNKIKKSYNIEDVQRLYSQYSRHFRNIQA